MKNSFKSFICAMALSTTVAFAGPGDRNSKPTTFEASIYTNIDGALMVNVEKTSTAGAAVLIKNASGDIIAREGIGRRQKKSAMRFDLSALRDGEYKLEIVSKGERIVRDFALSSETTVVKRALTFE